MKKTVINNIICVLLFTGIIAFAAYVIYAMLGNFLWEEYNPITTDISSLSAVGAPNQEILRPFLTIYEVCFLTFTITYTFWAFYSNKKKSIKAGAVLLLLMSLISAFGYGLFPLEGDKTQMTFQNLMHILVTAAVVFLSIAGLYFIAAGNFKDAKNKKFGKLLLVLVTIFTIFGATNPIVMGNNLPVLGLTERSAIYSLHFIMGIIGIYESITLLRKKESR